MVDLLGICLVFALVGLAAVPFILRRRAAEAAEEAATEHGRRRRGLLLVGLFIFGTLTVGFLTSRSATQNDEDADLRAQELETSILALATADPSPFLGNAVFINGSIKVPVKIDRASVGDAVTTTYSEVRVGRSSRCVIVRVHAADSPSSEITRRRC